MDTELLEELARVSADVGRRGRCKYADLMRDRAEMRETVDLAVERGITYTAITEVLKRRGVLIGRSTVERHYNGKCVCGRA